MKCGSGKGEYPDFCPTGELSEKDKARLIDLYTEDAENSKVAIAAAETEFENYCCMTRVEETIEFAGKIGAEKIGIATCIGLIRESRTLASLLRKHDFEVVSAVCKVGHISKKQIGFDRVSDKIGSIMCDPILQAEIMNREKTDLNIVMGLCVGHDSLFYKYAEGLTTTLVTKDRVTGHNPAAPLYLRDSYYKNL